jgi:hypothetical protein
MDHPARIYRKNSDIVARKIVDEMILVPVRRRVGDVESLYTLNEVGARIWELIDGKREVREIRNLLLREFEANEVQIDADLLEFLGQLSEIGAITEASRGEG